jgi:hypothetical protein
MPLGSVKRFWLAEKLFPQFASNDQFEPSDAQGTIPQGLKVAALCFGLKIEQKLEICLIFARWLDTIVRRRRDSDGHPDCHRDFGSCFSFSG